MGSDGAGGCDELLWVKATGEAARAGLPVEDPILDTLACLFGPGVGGGNGPSPSNDDGFVAAATADAYLSSVGGRIDCAGGFGIPFGSGGGGAVAAVDVTTGRFVATLARRIAGAGSLGFEGVSSF
jgi:hypothetical protein